MSSLIHAATLVLAGFWSMTILSMASDTLTSTLFLGFRSMVLIVICAVLLTVTVSVDAKRVIAGSTLVQMSIAILLYTMATDPGAVFCVNHCLYKSMVFLIAGVTIHVYDNAQDARTFGQGAFVTMLYGVLLLAIFVTVTAVAPTVNFYLKDGALVSSSDSMTASFRETGPCVSPKTK